MKIYGLKTCDTCRKAVKTSGAELVDVRENPLTRGQLEKFWAAFGEALINRKSTTWRGLSEAERAGESLDLLAAHPTLMKRPVVEKDGRLWLGWGAEVQAEVQG
ncbi:arsenate reductase family protein [Vannielia litorea]|uniref:Arsenate reductase, glutaredoxin family n=1 Tax=Vannielia litorea TaxID=1217970 RepID=A0A1N6EE84_9RHOB|nr:ArsC/Spx/MgsR family protein [Vannielia litorea]SIN81271.1 Arsenate reductase, glutaredoxin family [Vannielia litorea]